MKTSAFVFSIPKLFPLLLAPEAPFQNPTGPGIQRETVLSNTSPAGFTDLQPGPAPLGLWEVGAQSQALNWGICPQALPTWGSTAWPWPCWVLGVLLRSLGKGPLSFLPLRLYLWGLRGFPLEMLKVVHGGG